MRKISLQTNNLPLFLVTDSKLSKNKEDKFNIKGLKIAKSLENLKKLDLNNKNEKIKNLQNDLEKIKNNEITSKLKKSFEKILLTDDQILNINYEGKSNSSFNFEIFKLNKNRTNNTKNININKIPHPLNKNTTNKISHPYNKLIKNEELSNIENDKINYLEKYEAVIEERKNFEFNMHLYIKDLKNYLAEIKNNLKDLYNQENQILINNRINKNQKRRTSASSAIFGFFPKKKVKEKEKEKILKRKDKINILNYQLTDNISIYNCKDKFNNVANYNNTINHDIYIFNKSKIRKTEKEIQKTEKNLLKCVKTITNYYLNILKKSIDVRNNGMIWVIKRLLRLNYTPKLSEFPEFVDEKVYNYIVKMSKLKNEVYDLLKEFEEQKKELIKDDDFIRLQNKINEIYNFDNDYFNINKNNTFDKQRFYSADNKNRIDKEKNMDINKINHNIININLNKYNSNDKKISYLENKYDKYINDVVFFKLPDEIQILLSFLYNDIKFERNINKKTNKVNNLRYLSLNKEKNVLRTNKKSLVLNKSEIYSIKIKNKNKFIKLNEEQKWNREIKIKRSSVGEYLTQNIQNKEIEKKYRELLNISLDTYTKIEKYILLRLKIIDTNNNIKKEVKNIEKYLENKKDSKLYNNIYKFIYGNKIK